ncbi:dUTP diphosphatase [Comamonas thiooxydans]|uniref:dUTP diphosphatase n=1 Tax=Comamonas thiooxydans TaxID=363952 RepID=UPI000B41D07C|nr:deoxyuridine 5'-triphosphate nucleotidohydrolase [Comamonas thiooxydans]
MIHVPFNIALVHPLATVPQYQTAGAACFDLHALIPDDTDPANPVPGTPIAIQSGHVRTFRTGVIFDLPPGWRIDGFGRSGAWFKANVRLGNCVCKLDQDFRGELMLSLHNMGPEPFVVENGDRIAQAEINPVYRAVFSVVSQEQLTRTDRGANGLGSSGGNAA